MNNNKINILTNLKTDNYIKYLLIKSYSHDEKRRRALETIFEFISEINSVFYKVSEDMTLILRLNWWQDSLNNLDEQTCSHPVHSRIYEIMSYYPNIIPLCVEFIEDKLNLAELEFSEIESEKGPYVADRFYNSEYKLLYYILWPEGLDYVNSIESDSNANLLKSYSLLKFLPELNRLQAIGVINISEENQISIKQIQTQLAGRARNYFNSCGYKDNKTLLDKLIFAHVKYYLNRSSEQLLEILKGNKSINTGWYRLKLLMSLLK